MCYSGKCRYENHMGDCTITSSISSLKIGYPFDAGCVKSDNEIEIMDLTRDRDRYKSLYLATDARMRAAEKLIGYYIQHQSVIAYKPLFDDWQSEIIAHEKVLKEVK